MKTGKIVSVSFDDAIKNQHRNGLPAMERYGFRGTLGVVTGWVGQTYQHTPQWTVEAMTWEEIADFHRAGWEIASHSRLHRSVGNEFLKGPYSSLTAEELEEEIAGSKSDLLKHGYAPVTFIRPGSFYQNPLTITELEPTRTNYLGGRLYYSGVYTPGQPLLNSLVFPLPYDLFAVHLISYEGLAVDLRKLFNLLPEQSWLIFCIHGIDAPLGGSTTITPQDFETTLKILKEQDVSVVTIGEVLHPLL